MSNYKLKDIKWMSQDSILLTLEPKSDKDKLDFYPGQYLTIGFRKFGRPSPVRCFSIVSSPNSNNLQLGIRVYGIFTKSLAHLKPGTNMFVQGPFGNFVIDEEQDKNIIMLAAGIGITPYMSMLRYITEEQVKLKVSLVYAVRSSDNMPFYEELINLEKNNPYLKVIYLVSDNIRKSENPRFIKGLLSNELLDNLTKKYYSPYTFFICGPKGFKDTAIDILKSSNVASNKIITEEFTPSTQIGSDPEGETVNIPKVTYGLSFIALAFLSAFIMSIDLIRQVPKLQNASSTSSVPSSNTPVNTNSNNNNSTSSPSYQSTPTTSNNSYSAPTPSQNTYTAPTTSVS
ncbi:MAG: FAD-dependent oxidoreductase [bacterium]